MVKFYPSHQALRIADQILDAIANRVPGYQGRIGVHWYWRLKGGILVTFKLDFTITEQRWDTLHAEAVTPKVGQFSSAEFPFAAYGTLKDAPPFIHDLEGEAEWSNRLYFQMGHLIDDASLWMQALVATVLDPQISPPAAFPDMNPLEQELVHYAISQLNGHFIIKELHEVFKGQISRRALSSLAQRWEELGLLTEHPRRVTIALRVLLDQARTEIDWQQALAEQERLAQERAAPSPPPSAAPQEGEGEAEEEEEEEGDFYSFEIEYYEVEDPWDATTSYRTDEITPNFPNDEEET